jgi:hypothetical protein
MGAGPDMPAAEPLDRSRELSGEPCLTRSCVSSGPAGSGDAPEELPLVHVPVAAVPLPQMAKEAGLTRGLGHPDREAHWVAVDLYAAA